MKTRRALRSRRAARRGRAARADADELDRSIDGSLARFVDVVVPHLPPGLVGPDTESHIRAAVRNVPAELVARFVFECRLDVDAPDAAIAFCADAETGGLQMLAGRHPLVVLPQRLAESEAWAPVVRFCRRREPGGLLHRATADVWTDLELRTGYEPVPRFAFGMRLAGLPEAPCRPLEVLIRGLEQGFEALAGEARPPTGTHATVLRSVLAQLPDTARVARAGLRAGDGGEVRLWLTRTGRPDIDALVEATRGGGEALAVRHALYDIAAPAASIRPRIDVGLGVGPVISLICSIDGDGSPPAVAARWHPLLNRLVENELCTPAKRDALAHCYGLLRERQSERWPEYLTRLSELFGGGTESVLSWHVHHVDLRCEHGEPVSASASILVSHGWSKQ